MTRRSGRTTRLLCWRKACFDVTFCSTFLANGMFRLDSGFAHFSDSLTNFFSQTRCSSWRWGWSKGRQLSSHSRNGLVTAKSDLTTTNCLAEGANWGLTTFYKTYGTSLTVFFRPGTNSNAYFSLNGTFTVGGSSTTYRRNNSLFRRAF